jgi:hypothetical protein
MTSIYMFACTCNVHNASMCYLCVHVCACVCMCVCARARNMIFLRAPRALAGMHFMYVLRMAIMQVRACMPT